MEIGKILEKAGLAINEVEIMLAHVLDKDRSFVKAFPEFKLHENQVSKLKEFIKRRMKNEPLAYIIGYQEFLDFKVKVDERVLIPRPETEALVSEVIGHVYSKPNRNKANLREIDVLTIVDVGTGSGNIAIGLAKAIPFAKIYGTDIDPKALELAKENSIQHNQERVNLVLGNLLEPIEEEIDIIVANLPYIPTSRIKTLQKEVAKWEPKLALDGGKDGLALYRLLFKQAKEKLKRNGKIFYEVDGDIFTLHKEDL